MSGRRTSLASLAGAKVDDVPGKSEPLLLTLALDKLVPTRFNPRRNFGSPEELADFGEKLKKRQLQPAVVVSRAAYLKLWPEETEHVGTASYVIANGERRYRASLEVDLPTLNVVHTEDVAKSRADFLDAVLSENLDREDLDPIERAIGIDVMVAQLGGTDKVARHYDKTKGWVSQQRKLLKLTPDLQALVSLGEIPIRVARDIAGLAAAEQASAWEAEQQSRAEAEQQRRAKLEQRGRVRSVSAGGASPRPDTAPLVPEARHQEAVPPASTDSFTAVNSAPLIEGSSAPSAPAKAGSPSMLTSPTGAEPQSATVPAQQAAEGFDWADPEAVAALVCDRMTLVNRKRLASILLRLNTDA